MFVDGIISVLIPVSIQALVPILMPVLMLTSRPRKFWQLSFSVRSQVRIMPAWCAFFRQMILAGRRSSDKVPSLLAHSAGTRKQKRPFLCRTAAFLWGKMYVFNIYCCCRIHHPERCGAGLRQKIDADLFNKPMELHGEIRILVAVNQRLNVRFSHNIYM